MFPEWQEGTWTWSEEAGQHYRHLFYGFEPDLDVASPAVRDEIAKIVRFWLRLGVSGFRIDAAPHLARQAGRVRPEDDRHWYLADLRRFVVSRLVRVRRQVPEIGTGRWHIVHTGCSTVLGIRYDAGRTSVITMVNLADEEVEVQARAFEELEHVGDVLADQPYRRPEADTPLRLGPHGYRWVRGRSRYQS